jgi:hypothetical protein
MVPVPPEAVGPDGEFLPDLSPVAHAKRAAARKHDVDR